MKAQITFRSGVQIMFDVTSLESGRGRFDGELRQLTWETPGDWTAKLHRVELSEVVAIVMLREPGEVPDAD